MLRLRERTNTWPGFVDLFSNLVIILIFLLIVFVVLWTTTNVFSGGGKVVADLKKTTAEQTEVIGQMTADSEQARELLIMARNELEKIDAEKSELQSELNDKDMSMEELVAAYERKIYELQGQNDQMQRLIDTLNIQLSDADSANAISAQTLDQLNAALSAAEEKMREQSAEYVEITNRLNRAMATKISELSEYQSQFYKSVKQALAGTTTVDTTTDRFVIGSDILFPSGAYSLSPEGKNQLRLIANVINNLEAKIPADTKWIIRVDGHTDKTRVVRGTRGYSNNMELSLLRARAIVAELMKHGVSKMRLVPTGFGEMYPVQLGGTRADLQANRRIELRLTNP